MIRKRKGILAVLVAVLAAASLAFALAASADHGNGGDGKSDDNGQDHHGQVIYRSVLAPSVPTDPKLHGIGAGGAPWSLTSGNVRLKSDGELDLRVRGLILTALGNAGPVTTISASLLCGADATAGAAATTAASPLSSAGNGHIEATIALPSTCLAPIVLVNPNGNAAAYIAVSGWKS